MKRAPEYHLEIITDGKRTVYPFESHERAIESLIVSAREPDVISVELHIVIATVNPKRAPRHNEDPSYRSDMKGAGRGDKLA